MISGKLKHHKILRHVCENLDQQLNSAKCRQIKKHLGKCPDCAAYLRSLKTTVALYRRYPAPSLSAKTKKKLRSIPYSKG